MYKVHPSFPEPDRNIKIWHYFKLPFFLSLLHSSSLFLCRHDKFDDGFEGRLSSMDKRFFEGKASSLLNNMKWDSWGCSFSNCWTQSEVDEYVLWSTYSSLANGVAVQSTVGKLIDSLDPDDERCIYVSDVLYIDYERDYTFKKTGGYVNMMAAHFSKRKYFASEKEIRVMHFNPNARFDTAPEFVTHRVQLSKLVENVYISPFSKDWFKEVITDLLSLYGLGGIRVCKSDI